MDTMTAKRARLVKLRHWPRVLLCGSLSALDLMETIELRLRAQRIPAIRPHVVTEDPDDKAHQGGAFLERLGQPAVWGLLVVNPDRPQTSFQVPYQHHYIGVNTWMEIGAARAAQKQIYVLTDFPTTGMDELRAFGAHALRGNLDPLIRDYARLVGALPEWEIEPDDDLSLSE